MKDGRLVSLFSSYYSVLLGKWGSLEHWGIDDLGHCSTELLIQVQVGFT